MLKDEYYARIHRRRTKKLQEMGYNFEGPEIKSIDEATSEPLAIEGDDSETPKAIEAAPTADATETETAKKEAKDSSKNSPEDELAVEEPSKASKQDAAKSSKKGKKSSKAKSKKVAA